MLLFTRLRLHVRHFPIPRLRRTGAPVQGCGHVAAAELPSVAHSSGPEPSRTFRQVLPECGGFPGPPASRSLHYLILEHTVHLLGIQERLRDCIGFRGIDMTTYRVNLWRAYIGVHDSGAGSLGPR